jgi:signal peptidase
MKAVKIVRFIYNIITVVLVAAIILLTLLAVLLGVSGMDRQNPKSLFGFRAFIVLSPSMVPEFDEGSLIIIREADADKLQAGDIITYVPKTSDDALLTHRIARIEGQGENKTFITRGDANNTDDPNPVEPDRILGKAIFYMDGLGTFIVNLRTPVGIAGMVGVIVVGLFVIPYLLSPRETNKKDKTKNKNNNIVKEDESGDLDQEILPDETGLTDPTDKDAADESDQTERGGQDYPDNTKQ